MTPANWQTGFPAVVERQGASIVFELKVGDVVRAAYAFPAEGQVWKDADTFNVIPYAAVEGWREPIPKTCRYGNHPIDEIADGGLITFWVQKEDGPTQEDHACRACHRTEQVREFGKTGMVRTPLWMAANTLQHTTQTLRHRTDFEDGQRFRRFCTQFAERLLEDEAAFGQITLAPGVVAAVEKIRTGVAAEEDFRLALRGPNLFWFERLVRRMVPVVALAKVWEREVWFGGKDRSQDDRYTEPYSPRMPESRSYLEKPAGHGTGSSIREDVLIPGSLQAFVIPARYHRYAAKVGDVEYTSFTSAGRSVFSISTPTASVNLIEDETSPMARGGVGEISANPLEALVLIQWAIDDWKAGKIQAQWRTHDGDWRGSTATTMERCKTDDPNAVCNESLFVGFLGVLGCVADVHDDVMWAWTPGCTP